MPHIDFSAIEEPQDFTPIPTGRYRASVSDVEESATRHGDEMWKVKFTILDGDCEGRTVFDNIVFSEKAYPRLKMFCSRLGVDVKGAVDLAPEMLLDKTCLLTVEEGEYQDRDGNAKPCNTVPFAGYEVDPGPSTNGESGDGDPF
jgi:hypothetical protein